MHAPGVAARRTMKRASVLKNRLVVLVSHYSYKLFQIVELCHAEFYHRRCRVSGCPAFAIAARWQRCELRAILAG